MLIMNYNLLVQASQATIVEIEQEIREFQDRNISLNATLKIDNLNGKDINRGLLHLDEYKKNAISVKMFEKNTIIIFKVAKLVTMIALPIMMWLQPPFMTVLTYWMVPLTVVGTLFSYYLDKMEIKQAKILEKYKKDIKNLNDADTTRTKFVKNLFERQSNEKYIKYLEELIKVKQRNFDMPKLDSELLELERAFNSMLVSNNQGVTQVQSGSKLMYEEKLATLRDISITNTKMPNFDSITILTLMLSQLGAFPMAITIGLTVFINIVMFDAKKHSVNLENELKIESRNLEKILIEASKITCDSQKEQNDIKLIKLDIEYIGLLKKIISNSARENTSQPINNPIIRMYNNVANYLMPRRLQDAAVEVLNAAPSGRLLKN